MAIAKRVCFCFILLFSGLLCRSQSFLNGDFENTTAVGDQINLANAAWDAEVPNDSGFGTAGNLDIITSSFYGGGPEHGNWYCGMTGAGTDQLSLKLNAPLVAGNTYSISFYERKDPTFNSYPLQVGLSTDGTTLGTAIYTSPAAINGVWTQNLFSFIAPNNGQYITVEMTCCGVGDWVNLDNFTFTCGLNLGPDTTLCDGSTYLLNATTANATSYLWQDGSTNATFQVTSPGQYWVQVSSPGCNVSDTVIVSYNPAPVVNLGNDTGLCSPATFLLNAGNNGDTYLWQDGSTSEQYLVSQTGTYSVTVSAGNCSANNSIQVSISNSPVVNLGNDTSICNGQGLVLNAGNPTYTYQWQDGSTNQTFDANSTGAYWVNVSNNGCIGSDTVLLTFTSLNINLGNDTTVCTYDTVILNAARQGATYLWQDGSTASTYTVSQTGTYSTTVSNSGCTGSDSVLVIVRPAPLIVVSASKDTICSSDSAQICATPGFVTYSWNAGGSATCIYTQYAGNYYVTVTDSFGCIAQSNHLALHVITPPSVSISVSGDTLQAYNAASYQWYANQQAIPGATRPVYFGTPGIEYQVLVTDSSGCSELSNAVDVVTGIIEPQAAEIEIYPNPSTGSWQLVIDDEFIGAEIQVFDAGGKMVFNSILRSSMTNLDFDAARGVYLLRISSGTNTVIKKLIRL